MAKMSELPDDILVVSEKEYIQLKKDQAFLHRLCAAGVDNWEGYADCFEDDDDQ